MSSTSTSIIRRGIMWEGIILVITDTHMDNSRLVVGILAVRMGRTIRVGILTVDMVDMDMRIARVCRIIRFRRGSSSSSNINSNTSNTRMSRRTRICTSTTSRCTHTQAASSTASPALGRSPPCPAPHLRTRTLTLTWCTTSIRIVRRLCRCIRLRAALGRLVGLVGRGRWGIGGIVRVCRL
jgi:hypothetical protein